MKKIGLFFGGISNEREVSIMSAKNIVKNFDFNKYELILLYWAENGKFYKLNDINNLEISKSDSVSIESFKNLFDIALPITHGKYGEDGALQGLFEVLGVKYCGCHVLDSALCMDKSVFRDFLSSYGLPMVKYENIDFSNMDEKTINSKLEKLKKEINLPIFVKPSNSGSSVGITRVDRWDQMNEAIQEARRYDGKIIFEQGLSGAQEIEVAVLGNSVIKISTPGELKSTNDFYDFDDKYQKGEAEQIIPAKISNKVKNEIIKLTEKAYRLCRCHGFARVDFFLLDDEIYLNEINTLPGFTDISMYPMLMRNTGMSYKELINKIVELA